jgi:hypothetical protein
VGEGVNLRVKTCLVLNEIEPSRGSYTAFCP